jgi:hypothetical protein
MRFSASKSVWILLSTWVVPTTEAQVLVSLFDLLFRPFIQSACNIATSTLGLDSTFDCSCDVRFKGLFQGFSGDVGCELDPPRCLVPPNLYCATGSIDLGVEAGVFFGTDFSTDIEACFDVKSGLPNNVASVPNICFKFVPDGLKLTSCTVSVGDTPCTSCEICDSGVDFKFDCSNVDLVPESNLIFVPGPTIASCIGLSLIPTNTSSRV